jgi:hypothetical protein
MSIPPHEFIEHYILNEVFGIEEGAQVAPTSDDPSASVILTAVNGTASTFMRSDAAPPLDQSIAPAWTGLHRHVGAAAYSIYENDGGVTSDASVLFASTNWAVDLKWYAWGYEASTEHCVLQLGGGITSPTVRYGDCDLIVEGNGTGASCTLGETSSTSDINLKFITDLGTETLHWDYANTRFELSDDLFIDDAATVRLGLTVGTDTDTQSHLTLSGRQTGGPITRDGGSIEWYYDGLTTVAGYTFGRRLHFCQHGLGVCLEEYGTGCSGR